MASQPGVGIAPAPRSNTVARTRPYKDFLTPALHRSFTSAASVGVAVCWVDATLMSEFSFFWSWFPLGMTGLRTGVLFISCLTIFILRVAYLHVGRSTCSSPAATFLSSLASKRTLWTFIWYWISAFLFSEIYMHSISEAANLAWVDSARSYERPRLNERAILFRSLFGILAAVQTLRHILFDYDTLVVPPPKKSSTQKAAQAEGDKGQVGARLSLIMQLQKQAPAVLLQTLAVVVEVAVFGPFAYFLVLRQTAWSASFRIAKLFYRVQQSRAPTGLEDVFSLFGRFVFAAWLLVLLWEITNKTFTTFAEKSPLKKGQPLTNDSTNPNGSLVNGLKSKREIPHTLALWELQIISESFELRRKTIFGDFEKPGASTWIDVMEACLQEILSVSESIRSTLSPTPPPTAEPPTQTGPPQKPRLTQPLHDDPRIFSPVRSPATTFDALAEGVGSLAKSIGQPTTGDPNAEKPRLLTNGDSKAPPASPSPIIAFLKSYTLDFLRTPVGSIFRVSFARHMDQIVFGHPYSNAVNVHLATKALCQLTVSSLTEDPFGQVQKDVGRIVRALGQTIADVELLERRLEPHWTDVCFREEHRTTEEVEELKTVLRDGLGAVLLTFGEYAAALGISPAELRRAKELVGKSGGGVEMVKR